jgi:NAD(P)-dependent dehydrogenase (short-subunit alcohol dehydrogenase family)
MPIQLDEYPSRGSLSGRVAVITGGGGGRGRAPPAHRRGIGRATVELFLAAGASVVFCGRDAAVGDAVAAQLSPSPVAFVAADVALEADVARVVEHAAARFGPPTIVVNNAGVNANFDATTMTSDGWDRFFAIDLKASWLTVKHAVPHMRATGGGAIVNVSSIHGFATLPGFFPYAAAKSGLVGLTRSLALDHGPDGVRVNCVAPGFTRTRLVQDSIDRAPDPSANEARMVRGVALGRIAEPIEVARAIRFLASDEASYVTGASLLVDGGLTARRAG